MFSTLESLDLAALSTVTGGAEATPPPNRDGGKFNVGITRGTTQVGVQGEYERTRSDYAKCLQGGLDRGWTPEQISGACGRPPGAS